MKQDEQRRPSECHSQWDADFHARNSQDVHEHSPARQQLLKTRDKQLAAVEGCGGVDRLLVRLTRAALWPECADAIAGQPLPDAPVRDATLPDPNRTLNEIALQGHAVAARLDRLDLTIAKANGYAQCSLATCSPWLAQTLVPQLERKAAVLQAARAEVDALPTGSYGHTIAQWAWAAAWTRLLHGWRGADPSRLDLEERARHYSEQAQIRLPYEATLNEAKIEAVAGVPIASDWVLLRRWRNWNRPGMAEVPQRLLVPPLLPSKPSEEPNTALAERLAALLPSYVAGQLVEVNLLTPSVLRALVSRGFDPRLRRLLSAESDAVQATTIVHPVPGIETREALAQGHLTVALWSFDAQRARWTVELLGETPATETGRWLAAIGAALAQHEAGFVAWSQAIPDPLTLKSGSRGNARSVVSELDALAQAADVSPATRSGAAIDAWLLAMPWTEALPVPDRGALAYAEIEPLGMLLRGCLPVGFMFETGCACPTLRALR